MLRTFDTENQTAAGHDPDAALGHDPIEGPAREHDQKDSIATVMPDANSAKAGIELPADCNEIDIANYCLGVAKNIFSYLTRDEKYRAMLWENETWQDLNGPLLDRKLRPIIAALPDLITDPKFKMEMRRYLKCGSRVTQIRNTLLPLAPLVERTAFDSNPNLIGVLNGKVDLLTGEYSELNPSDLISKSLGTKFDPGAKCPRFEQFIGQIMMEDPQLIAIMQQILGYCLFGHNQARVMFFFRGMGRNGKSTLINVLTRLFGSYASPLPQKVVTGNNPNELGDALKAVQGFRILTFAEMGADTKLAVPKLKAITGGDDQLVRNPHRQDWTTVKLGAKILFTSNSLPFAEDASHALWDRLRIVPFDYRVPKDEINHRLEDDIAEEFPGVLNWLLVGVKTVIANNLLLDETPRMIALKNAYRQRGGNGVHPLGTFLEQHFVPDAKGFTLSKDLLENFNTWVSEELKKPTAILSSFQQLRKAMADLEFARYADTRAIMGYFMTRKSADSLTPAMPD